MGPPMGRWYPPMGVSRRTRWRGLCAGRVWSPPRGYPATMRATARPCSPLTPPWVAGAVLGLLLSACGEEPAPSRTDDLRLYAALTSNADPAACGQISDAGLRGECMSMAASALAAAGQEEAADAACEAMEASFWKDECWFLVADQAVTRGPDVARRCGQAGRLRNQCLTHAFDRELAESRVELAGQGEAAFEADLTERFSAFVPGQRGARAAHVMVAGMIGERERGQPFHLGLCGDASAETCRDAFVLRV